MRMVEAVLNRGVIVEAFFNKGTAKKVHHTKKVQHKILYLLWQLCNIFVIFLIINNLIL